MNSNRFIKTYERMDGPLNNYTQIKEVKELPRLDYTGEVYIHGSLTDVTMASAGITENPVDGNTFVQAFLGEPNVYVVIVKDYNDLPEKGEDNAYYVVVNEQKLYSYDSSDNKYTDDTEIIKQSGMVYVGTDKSVIGTMDITQDDPKGTIGFYLIIQEPEDVSTSTIYKKEIINTTEPVNEWYIFGDKCQVITSEYLESEEYSNIVQKHMEKLPNLGFGWLYLPFFVPTNMINTSTNVSEKILSNDSDYTFYYKDSGTNHHPDLAVEYNKTFDNINELKNWLLLDEEYKVWEETNDEPYDTTDSINLMREYFKTSKEKDGIDATPIYTDKLDTSLDLTQIPFYIVMAKGESKDTGVYQYYIYNGKEYIELGGEDSYIILNVDSVENFSGELTDKELKIIKKENTNIIVTDGSIIAQCVKQLSMGNNIFFQAFDGTSTLVVTIDTTTKKYTGKMEFPLSSILLNGKEVEQFNGQAEINISNAEIIERTMITWGKLDNALTINEFNKLKNTKAILKITYNAIGCDFYLENPTVYTTNTSSSSLTQLIYNVSLPTSLSQFSNTPEMLFIFKENTLNSFSYKHLNEYVPQVLGYLSNIYNEIDIYPLLGFVTSSEYPKLHLPKSICLGKFVYNSDVYSFTPSSNPIIPFITTLSKVSTNHYGTFEAVLETTDNNRYSCILHITKESSGSDNTPTNSEGTFIIYDTTTNKVTYVLLKLKYNNESFAVDYLKAYQDGAEVTSTFVTKISSIYLNLL